MLPQLATYIPTLIIEISSGETKSFLSTFYGQKYPCSRGVGCICIIQCNSDSPFRDDPGLYLWILGGGGGGFEGLKHL